MSDSLIKYLIEFPKINNSQISHQMKKIIFLLLFTVVFFSADAQLLWKVSGKNVEKPSYIFGTHHVASPAITDKIKGFEKAFNSCSVFYGELIMEDMGAMGMQMAPLMICPQDSLLDKLYSEDDYKILDEYVNKYLNVSVDMMKMLKPHALSTQLAMMQAMRIFKDFNPMEQIDQVMQVKAKEKGMQVKGFEDVIFQANLLFGTPITEQADALLKMAKNDEKTAEATKALCDMYMNQEINKFLDLTKDPDTGMSEEELERMLFSRNRNWVETLKNVLPSEAAFIVVGAGHLPGKEGMIELLKKEGYKVNPVK